AIRFEFPDDHLEKLTVINPYGDKEILLSAGQIVISGDSGKTVVEGHSDSLHILNTNGAIEVKGHHTSAKARTTNGAISFGGRSEQLMLETLNGAIRADLDALSDAGELRMATTTGAVVLHLPQTLPASTGAFVRSNLGSVKSDIALLEETQVRQKKVQIYIKSDVGSVRIEQEP
ncbi:MAG: hypothetical protein Q4A52_03765, partial [Bacillota bacterium]|nr:hypothetical protein [Bacillota bacterium]